LHSLNLLFKKSSYIIFLMKTAFKDNACKNQGFFFFPL